MVLRGSQRTKHLCGLSTQYKAGAMEAQVSFPGARAWLNRERWVFKKEERMGQEYAKERGQSRLGAGDMGQRQGVTNDPPVLERRREIPCSWNQCTWWWGGWAVKVRLWNYLLCCQGRKLLPHSAREKVDSQSFYNSTQRATAKSWASEENSVNSGKATKNTEYFECQRSGTSNRGSRNAVQEELLNSGQGRPNRARPRFSVVGGATRRATERIRETIHNLLPTTLGMCIWFIQFFFPGHVSNRKFSLLWGKYIFTNTIPIINLLHGSE